MERMLPASAEGARLSVMQSASILAFTFALAWPSLALAQPVDQPADQPATGEEALGAEILVTGSRIARQGFDAPAPMTVLNAADIAKLGLTNVASVIAQLPQNSQFVTPTNVGQTNFNIGASLANLRGLNPFFGTRTLTLVDTRRFVPTTDTGAVDLNVVPSVLVGRVETVTGGASAAYGTDAVAGVVNIILDTQLEGFKGQLDYGISSHGDGRNVHGSAAWGTAFAGGRGRFIIGGEYEQADAIAGCAKVRNWCATSYGLFTNGGYATPGAPGFGAPHYILGPNAREYNSRTGVFPFGGPLGTPVQFNAAGTALVPYTAGAYANPFSFDPMQGGATELQSTYYNNALRAASERYSLLAHGEYELSDKLNVYVEGSYYRNNASNIQPLEGNSAFKTPIQPDNVFLPFPGAVGPSPQPFINDLAGLPSQKVNRTTTETYRGVFGVKGDLFDNWGFDAYYTYGRSIQHVAIANSGTTKLLANAVDAVAGPGGRPACRINVDANPNNNDPACVPLNLFGMGNIDPAAFAYAYRTLFQDEVYQQHVASATIHGDLFNGWSAGPIGFAGGVEYRHESIIVTHDIQNNPYYSDIVYNYGLPFRGTQDIVEGFAEINVPILKDVSFFKSLSVDGAVRQTRNRTNGGSGNINTGVFAPKAANTVDFTTWKLNGIWDVNDWIRFRATRSRDVRAPSFYELYQQYVSTGGFFGQVSNPNSPTPAVQDVATITLGGSNSGLGPEIADTWTVGSVVTGHGALNGFKASVDWYQINLKGPISALGWQNIVNACDNQGTFCDLLDGIGPVAGGFRDITVVNNFNLNLGNYVTRGFDIEADYNTRMGSSAVGLRVIASYLYDLIIDPGTGATVYNYAGITGATPAFGYFNTSPNWQGKAFLTIANGGFIGTIQAHYIGSGKFASLDVRDGGLPYLAPGDPGYATTNPLSISSNHVNSALYINLNASYKLQLGMDEGRTVELFGLVNNVFNKTPPVAPGGNGFPTNPVYFDTIGTSFKFGVRVRY